MCRDLRNVAKALEFKKSDLLDVEKVQRDKLKWREEKHGANIRQVS